MSAKSVLHPLAARENLALSDFKDYPFYVTVPEGMDKPILDIIHACNMVGFQPKLEHLNSLSACYVKMFSEYGVFAEDELLLAISNLIFPAFVFQASATSAWPGISVRRRSATWRRHM